MTEGRVGHGLIKLKSIIYAFGGWVDTAEKYDLTNDTWTRIDNEIPESIDFVHWVYHLGFIYIAHYDN